MPRFDGTRKYVFVSRIVLSLILLASEKTGVIRRLVPNRLRSVRGLLDAYEHLCSSQAMHPLPSEIRRRRARKLVIHFSQGRDVASHVPGFHPFLVPVTAWPIYPDLAYAARIAPPETILPVVSSLRHAEPVPGVSLGLHIHAHFADGLPALRDAIMQNRSLPELYITGPERNRAEVHKAFHDYPRRTRFFACRNIGRDVVPFLRLLPLMRRAGHDLVGHVHIKKSAGTKRDDFVRRWSDFLITTLIGDAARRKGAIDDIAAHFAATSERPALYLPQMTEPIGWGENRAIAEDLFATLHPGPLPDRFLFSPGTMFWATPYYLQAFELLALPWADVAGEPLPDDGTVLHAIERLFGAVAWARKDRVAICLPSDGSFVFSMSLMRRLRAKG